MPMHALLLEFQHTRRRPGWFNLLLLAGGLFAIAYLAFQFFDIHASIDRFEFRQVKIEHQLHQTTDVSHLSATDAQKLRAEIKDAQTVLIQLSLPWSDLFRDIGAAQQNGVALLSIVPDASRRSITITGEAKDLSTVLEYIRVLQKASSMKSVYLQNHKIELRSAERPVHFTILAKWMFTQ
jgi:Tfp pilus assembly protein PilN